ncbi:MAG: helix-turn-helix transcriptional regulator [Ruminococcaceae bacterium]|nr:helix-turn-helix transcriptional regulator [Oscillospiraceae bacterium]
MEKTTELKARAAAEVMSVLLKMLRENRGYTVQKAAQITAFSEEEIINYESAVLTDVSMDVLVQYCKLMNCDFFKLLICAIEITNDNKI